MKRRYLLLCGSAALLCGCTSWNLNTFSWKTKETPEQEKSEGPPKYVGDLASPFGMFPVKVEAVSLVKGLKGTGSDPAPGPQRSRLLEELKRRDVKDPNGLLATRNVSMVLVRGILRPGIQKGDRFDVEVRIPNRSETASLRGGYLLETRLTDTAILEGTHFEGKLRALAKGPVMVDPSASEKSDPALLGRGRILGGGIALQPRLLGLVLKSGDDVGNMAPAQLHASAVKSARVANAVNRRFHTFQKGIKVGVATAKTGKYVDLVIHPRYKDNVDRYMHVLRAVILDETATEQSQRIAELEKKLLEPGSAAQAAVELEAIGKPGLDALLKGLRAQDREVQLYAAEALAYLDRGDAVETLALAARDVPAFRVLAFTALTTLRDDFLAYDHLRQLLGVHSAETRYGAFRALWTMNADDPTIKGEILGEQFGYHVLDVAGDPMVHVTRNRRAEVVLFGKHQRFRTPFSVNAGNRIMVTSSGGEEVSVACFAPNEPDQKRTVSPLVDEVLRAIVELGGTYPDVVQALQEAKAAGALDGRFEVDALPEAGRTYERVAQDDEETDSKSEENKHPVEGEVIDPKQPDSQTSAEAPAADEPDSDKKSAPRKGFLARIMGWNE
jgi:flagellar basal body P-ring protein FlgI